MSKPTQKKMPAPVSDKYTATSDVDSGSEETIKKLNKELQLEKDLTKILLKKQKEWTSLIDSLNPTIEALGKKIKTLQNDLHIKNRELTNILQSLSGGLIVTDFNGIITTFNRAAVAITGVSNENAIGKDINSLFRWPVLPDLTDGGVYQNISEGFHQEFSFKTPDFREVVIDTSTTLMESDDAEKQGIIINLNDITQLKKLKEEAERKNRLTAMGEIAMQVAHEIRNPLGSIELFLSMMKMDMDVDSNEAELVQHIHAAANSMNHIISNLLEYTRPKPAMLSNLNMTEFIPEFVEFVRFSAEQQGISIAVDDRSDNAAIRGNAELLKQVLHNLFVNACQAMPEGGYLKFNLFNYVENDPVILDRFQSKAMARIKSLPLLKLEICDSGKGMTEEIRKRIFDPFYTTREQGTGLGMSIVHKTMSAHGGAILVDSEVENGTIVSLLFPALSEDDRAE